MSTPLFLSQGRGLMSCREPSWLGTQDKEWVAMLFVEFQDISQIRISKSVEIAVIWGRSDVCLTVYRVCCPYAIADTTLMCRMCIVSTRDSAVQFDQVRRGIVFWLAQIIEPSRNSWRLAVEEWGFAGGIAQARVGTFTTAPFVPLMFHNSLSQHCRDSQGPKMEQSGTPRRSLRIALLLS